MDEILAELFDLGQKKSVCNRVESERVGNQVVVPNTVIQQANHLLDLIGWEVIKCDLVILTSFHPGFKKASEVLAPRSEDDLSGKNRMKSTRNNLRHYRVRSNARSAHSINTLALLAWLARFAGFLDLG